jgi:hypothetical protein
VIINLSLGYLGGNPTDIFPTRTSQRSDVDASGGAITQRPQQVAVDSYIVLVNTVLIIPHINSNVRQLPSQGSLEANFASSQVRHGIGVGI